MKDHEHGAKTELAEIIDTISMPPITHLETVWDQFRFHFAQDTASQPHKELEQRKIRAGRISALYAEAVKMIGSSQTC